MSITSNQAPKQPPMSSALEPNRSRETKLSHLNAEGCLDHGKPTPTDIESRIEVDKDYENCSKASSDISGLGMKYTTKKVTKIEIKRGNCSECEKSGGFELDSSQCVKCGTKRSAMEPSSNLSSTGSVRNIRNPLLSYNDLPSEKDFRPWPHVLEKTLEEKTGVGLILKLADITESRILVVGILAPLYINDFSKQYSSAKIDYINLASRQLCISGTYDLILLIGADCWAQSAEQIFKELLQHLSADGKLEIHGCHSVTIQSQPDHTIERRSEYASKDHWLKAIEEWRGSRTAETYKRTFRIEAGSKSKIAELCGEELRQRDVMLLGYEDPSSRAWVEVTYFVYIVEVGITKS